MNTIRVRRDPRPSNLEPVMGLSRRSAPDRPDTGGVGGPDECEPICVPWAFIAPRRSSTGAASRQRACARGGRPASRRPAWDRSRDSGCGLVPAPPGERRRTGRRPRQRETSPDGPSAQYRAIRRLICRTLRPSWRAASRYRNCLLNHPQPVHRLLCHRNGLLCHRPSRNQKGIF